MFLKRKEKGFTRKHVCQAGGFSHMSLYYWENGVKTPKKSADIVSWCKVLDVEVPRLPKKRN